MTGAIRSGTRRVRDPPEASERPPGAVSDRWPGYSPRFGRSGPPGTETQGVVHTGAKSLPRAFATPKSDRLLARTDPDPQFLHRPMRYDIGLPRPVI